MPMPIAANPVLRKEILSLVRLPRTVAMQLICIGMLGIIVLATWPQQGVVSLETRSRDNLAMWLLLGQLAVVILFVPGTAAIAICSEREGNSLEMLYASRLTGFQITTGKLMASLAWPLILLLSAAPFMAMAYHRGGIDLSHMLIGYAVLLASAVLVATVSLTVSAWSSQSGTALVVSYALVLLICGIVLVPAALMLDTLEGESAWVMHGVRSVSPVAALFSLLRPGVGDFGGESHGFSPAWQIFFPSAGAMVVLSAATLSYKLSIPPLQSIRSLGSRQRKRSSIRRMMFLLDDTRERKPLGTFNPLIGKERRCSQLRSGSWLIRVFYGTLLLSLGLAAMSLYGGAEHPDLLRYITSILVLLQFAVIAVVVPSLGSPMISSEIESDTFELIRLTPLSGVEIFWGKFVSTILPATLPAVALLPAYAAVCLIDHSYTASVMRMLPVIAAAIMLYCAVGLACSTFFSTTPRSTIASYAIVGTLTAFPVAAWLAGGAGLQPAIARACGFPGSLVIALSLLPNGDSEIGDLWLAHTLLLIILCVVLLFIASRRVNRLLQDCR